MKPTTAISLILDKRKPKPMNILIGSEGAVIRELQKKFSTTIEKFDPENPKQFSYLDLEIDIPLGVRDSVAVWDNPVISGNEQTFRYLVSALNPALPKESIEDLARTLSFELTGIRDFRVIYWTVMDRAANYTKKVWDKNPWEDAKKWLTNDPNVENRLNWIIHEVKAYAYARDENKKELSVLGVSAKKASFLKAKKYSNKLMYDTMVHLSRWKAGILNEYQTAMTISSTWSD
jgi:hypothetical protein